MPVAYRTLIVVIAALFSSALTAAPQPAETEPESENSQQETEDKSGTLFSITNLSFRVGFYDISSTTEIRVNGQGGRFGTIINLEDDLNVDDRKSTSYLSLSWRMYGRHFLELEQFYLDRSGNQTLTAAIEFDDVVFEIGATVNSFFDSKITRISYAYLLQDTDKFFLALSAGLHRTELSTGISEILASFSDQHLAIAEVTAPLPVIGLSLGWNIAEKWSMYGRAQIFRLSISEYTGRLDHATVKLEYDPFKHVGFGVGYDLFDMDLSIDRDVWRGYAKFRFHGPIFYVMGRF